MRWSRAVALSFAVAGLAWAEPVRAPAYSLTHGEELPEDPQAMRELLRERLSGPQRPAVAVDAMVESIAARVELERSLTLREGPVTLVDGDVVLDLGEAYRFLDRADTETVLREWKAAPPDEDVLGMVVPTGGSVFDRKTWVAVVEYEADGRASVDEAFRLVPEALMTSMRDQAVASAPEGGAVLPTSWSLEPQFRADLPAVAWVYRQTMPRGSSNVVGDVRILGRRGVLALEAIGSTDKEQAIVDALQDLAARARFVEGARWSDATRSDKRASYGVLELVAGAAAARVRAAVPDPPGVPLAVWLVGLVVVALGAARLLRGRVG